jgi:hypothetical protein
VSLVANIQRMQRRSWRPIRAPERGCPVPRSVFQDENEAFKNGRDVRFDGQQSGIALDHAVLHLDGAARRIDDAAELDENASPVRFTMRP